MRAHMMRRQLRSLGAESEVHLCHVCLCVCVCHRRGSGLILGPQMFPGQIVSPVNSEATQGTDTPTQGSQGPWPQVLGIALLHPNLAGTQGPALSR